MQDSNLDRAVLVGYAARALESAAGEPHVVRQIVEWLVGQESALLLALPCALVECVQRLQARLQQCLLKDRFSTIAYADRAGC